MKRFLTLGALLFCFSTIPPDSWAGPGLIDEPPLSMNMSWNLANNGMLFIGYDTDQNGKMDFHTLRVVITSYFSKDPVAFIALSYPANHIFFIKYETTQYYYVAVQNPHFYALDIDEDGEWDLMYKDIEEDGVNGNETFYASPSGKYKEHELLAKPGLFALGETARR